MPCLSLPCPSENTTQTLSKQPGNPNPSPDFADPFASLLRDSAGRFIAEYSNAIADFSKFSSIFSRLIHSVRDPPVEIVWFYSTVVFHGSKLSAPRRDRVSAVKDLFQLVVSCSASGCAAKRIAVLAPIVYELCHLAFDKEQSEREEIRSLVEGLVSFISICCTEIRHRSDGGVDEQRLSSSFSDVVRVWIVDRFEVGDEMKVFFPIAGDGVCSVLRTEQQCRVSYLAGMVMCEAFLLRLCLRFVDENSRSELESDVRNCAAQMISGGFWCFSFFESLLKMMLEPVLPVTNLLKSNDECFLRGVLYDSVMMADDSLFRPQLGTLLPSERLKNLAVTWLLVAEDAVRFIRPYGDQNKVITYMSVFSKSCFTFHLIKWITNQIGMQGKIVLDVSTPVALIKWMLLVEDQGVRVFNCKISKIRAKGVICSPRFEHMLPVTQPGGEFLDGEDLEMVDLEDTTPTTNGMTNAPNVTGQRKRKGEVHEMEIQFKFGKYQAHENSVDDKFCYSGATVV